MRNLLPAIKPHQITTAEHAMRHYGWHRACAFDHVLRMANASGESRAFHQKQARFHAGMCRQNLETYRLAKELA